MQSKFIRANTPSKYLKRTGLMPKGTTLKIKTRYNTSIVSSCSSSAATSPSSSISNSNIIGHRSWPVVHSGTASLPSLTEYNLARFMEQLNISDRSRHGVHSSSPTPYSAVEISHFSDGSSSHSGTD
ncbi:hypothetical protein PCASD_19776 [Puccinia coronata f. sp. avenae]|nr:hypothetical protein PCASD_19776 [Puccinia coronata f. sp. avenae]